MRPTPADSNQSTPSEVSRRQFLASSTIAAGVTLTGAPAVAAPVMLAQAAAAPRGFNPNDPALKYDLANADVLDPGARVRGRRDLGIKNGQIAVLLSAAIPAARTFQRYDAAGKLVTPGLIDLHTHSG
jgi:dihydroorotase